MVQILTRQNKPNLAYIFDKRSDELPPIVFLGGFRSDMMGSKAEFLSELCSRQNRSYLRFDYSAHGQSEGDFSELTISDWYQDVLDILAHTKLNNLILVGSSMGGWLSLLMLKNNPDTVRGFIGIAAAPDFTLWMEEAMTALQQDEMDKAGYILVPNDYGDPYIITQKLLTDGRKNLLLESQISFEGGVHLLQGIKDADVPWKTAERIKNILINADVNITYQENGNHSLSTPEDLAVLEKAVYQMNS